ncbi:Imm51 family immunity protein [uncultured Citricoccus sp.]|uniref:Imm51 family immunity protein n=1 Tax=uncultured Citricoccus sp. TaxID=614031 RepID=UPI0026094A78|nr:hypothetical protein [uncultured Citricoccus sp.]
MRHDLGIFPRDPDSSFELERHGPNNVVLELWGPPDWDKIGPTEQITTITARDAKLGPKPEGHQFPALRELTATWSRDLGPWLRGSHLRTLDIDRPTQATLDALDGVPLRFLRLRSARWSGPLRWPALPELEDLWFTLCKEADLTGLSTLPALREVRIDSMKQLTHLGELAAGHTLRDVFLADVHAVDDPTQLWNINSEEVTALGEPATSPWIIEALRSLTPEQEQQLSTAYTFGENCLRVAAGEAPVPETVSNLDEDFESLTFDPVNVPTAEVLETRDVRSTGHAWTDLVTWWWPELVGRLEMDPDGDLFAAYGKIEDLRELQEQLEPLLSDETALTQALENVPLDQLDS